jgi:hypothetical protein
MSTTERLRGSSPEKTPRREGPRYAIEEMTEMKLVTFNRRPL